MFLTACVRDIRRVLDRLDGNAVPVWQENKPERYTAVVAARTTAQFLSYAAIPDNGFQAPRAGLP
ncbi:hypothetical protein BH11GEM1_BH11GEM1_19360 [soil metagenome]